MNSRRSVSGPLRTSLIVTLFALGVPGVVLVALMFTGQWPVAVGTAGVAIVAIHPLLPPAPLTQLAGAYALVGALLAALVSVVHWLLPYRANRPVSGASVSIARRVQHIQAVARAFGYLEYPLLLVGTLAELQLALSRVGNQATNLSLLMLYLALWLFQLLLLMKRPVVGRVVTPRQQPVELVVVRAIDPSSKRVKATEVTDSSGRFRLLLHDGTYEFRAEKAGFSRSDLTHAVSGQTPSRLMLALQPRGPISERSDRSVPL